MRVDTSCKLFAGVRIDGRIREQLEKCPARDRHYFEDPESKYLMVLRGGDETYLGKLLDPAMSVSSMEDLRRNIWSILQRVCPGRRDETEIKLYAVTDSMSSKQGEDRHGHEPTLLSGDDADDLV